MTRDTTGAPAHKAQQRQLHAPGLGPDHSPQLIGDEGLLGPHNDTGEAQNQVAGDRELVLTQLIAPPVLDDEMERSVHLDHNPLAVDRPKLRVEIAPASEPITAQGLPDRLGQAEASTEADEVDLAERLRSLGDVMRTGDQRVMVPDLRVPSNRLHKCGRTDKPL